MIIKIDLNFIVFFFSSALILLPHYIRGGSREAWGRGYINNYYSYTHNACEFSLNTIIVMTQCD